MTTDTEAVQELLDDLYAFAKKELASGMSAEDVETALMERGLDLATAVSIVHDCETGSSASVTTRGGGRENVWIGAVICLIGLVVTIGSYSAAASSYGGGSYVIAWGAIVFGAIQMFQGLAQG